MGQKQSLIQVLALLLLLLAGKTLEHIWICLILTSRAAIILNMPAGNFREGSTVSIGKLGVSAADANLGVVCVLTASMLSGLSAALTQRALIGADPRHPFFFSAELAVYGIMFLIFSALAANNSDAKLIRKGSLFSHWDLFILIPVITNVT
jgi:hypothetical protein